MKLPDFKGIYPIKKSRREIRILNVNSKRQNKQINWTNIVSYNYHPICDQKDKKIQMM